MAPEKDMPVSEKEEAEFAVVDIESGENDNNNNGNAAAAGCSAGCACCLTCMGIFFGIPMIITGVVLCLPLFSWMGWALGAGIALIILGLLFFVGAIVCCVLTGVCAKKAADNNVQPVQTTVVVTGQNTQSTTHDQTTEHHM